MAVQPPFPHPSQGGRDALLLQEGREGRFFLLLRYVLIIAASYLLLFEGETKVLSPVSLLIAGALLSNVALSFLEEELLLRLSTLGVILCFDIAWLALGLLLKENLGGNILIIYFFVLFLAAMGENIVLVVTAAVLLGVMDLFFLGGPAGHQSIWASPALVRIPFILTVALFYGYLAEKAKRERQRALLEKEVAEQLAQVVEAQTHDLRRQAEELKKNYELSKAQAMELERANRVKDDFIGVMSHELRTPVSIIMGFTGIVRDGLTGTISPKQDSALESVTQAAKNLLGVINTIMLVTNIESGNARVEAQDLSLKRFLDELRSATSVPQDKKLTLRWDYPDDLPALRLDEKKLREILRNLIDNAVKFTEKGQVTVRARYISGRRLLELQVSDTGVGIPKEALPFIFEKFQQADGSERRAYGGVGLGLFIVKQLTKLLGGDISVASEPGKGSTFTVTFSCEAAVRDEA